MTRNLERSIILIDKPAGISSFKAARNAAWKLGVRKSGHSGTLDMNVTGLLVVALGEATKAISQLVGLDKTYEGTIALRNRINERVFRAACRQFLGRIVQLPPKKCAVKRAPRVRTVHSFEITSFGEGEVRFRAHVESGTYIRALIRDLGLMLGCGMEMASLRRTEVGPFGIDECSTIDELTAKDAMDVADALERIGIMREAVADDELDEVRLGKIIPRDDMNPGEIRTLVDGAGGTIALGRVVEGGIHPFRVFNL